MPSVLKRVLLCMMDVHQRDSTVKRQSLSSRNRSGVTGVYFSRRLRTSGQTHYYWIAAWSTAGIQHKKRFSVAVVGYEEAFRRACALRARQSGAPRYSGPVPPHRSKAEARAMQNRTERRHLAAAGVALTRSIAASEKTYYSWSASWGRRCARHIKRFSVNALGYEKAFRQACAWRAKQMGTPPYKGAVPPNHWMTKRAQPTRRVAKRVKR